MKTVLGQIVRACVDSIQDSMAQYTCEKRFDVTSTHGAVLAVLERKRESKHNYTS